jgi:poly(A) polymerase
VDGRRLSLDIDESLIDHDMSRPINRHPLVSADDVCSLFAREGTEIFVMGGAVRNWMLGEHARDIDMVVSCSIEDALDTVTPLSDRIKIKPKMDFGLIYLIGDIGDIDVNSLRDCDDIRGNPDIDSVVFRRGKSLEIDAQIRDFTINAFYMRVSDRLIINHFKEAMDDLHSRTIRLIMDSRKLAIDYRTTIRILQFMARGYKPTDYTLTVLRERLDADILRYDKYGEWLNFHVPPSSADREAFRTLALRYSRNRAATRRLETWFGEGE